MLKQRWSPLQLTRTWGRHVPGRSKDGRDWKNHIIVARQRKTQGPHLRQPFCFLSTINALSLKDHPTGGTYSIKTRRKRGPKKAKRLQRPQDFLCAFVGRAGGDIATLTGIYNRLPAKAGCAAAGNLALGEWYLPHGLQPQRMESTPSMSLT